jgi:hypothetical protein
MCASPGLRIATPAHVRFITIPPRTCIPEEHGGCLLRRPCEKDLDVVFRQQQQQAALFKGLKANASLNLHKVATKSV